MVRTLEDFEHQWRKGGHDQSLGFARSWSQGGLTGWDQMGSQTRVALHAEVMRMKVRLGARMDAAEWATLKVVV